MPAIYEYSHTVGSSEIDEIGVASNVAYIRWMMFAATAHSEAQGLPTEAYLRRKCGWVVRSHRIEYRRPALSGDRIIVRTWVATMEAATSLRRYRIVPAKGEETLAIAETLWAFIDFATRRPTRIPPDIAEAFEIVTG